MFVWTSGFQNPLAHTHFNMFVDQWTSANESPELSAGQGGLSWGVSARGVWQTPPSEQNDRQVQKHYPAATTLRSVIRCVSLLQYQTNMIFSRRRLDTADKQMHWF